MASLFPFLDAAAFPPHLQEELTSYDRDLVGCFNRVSRKWEIWIRDKEGREGRKSWHRVHRWPGQHACRGMIMALRACDTWNDADDWADSYIARQDAEEAAARRDYGNFCESVVSDNVVQLRRDMETIRPHGVSESDILQKGDDYYGKVLP